MKQALEVSSEIRDALLGYLKDSIVSGIRLADALWYSAATIKLKEAAAELDPSVQVTVVPIRGEPSGKWPALIEPSAASPIAFIDHA